MLITFFHSIRLYALWLLYSLWPGRHAGAPLGWRRLCVVLLVFPLFLALQLIHWLCFLLDELLFRDYRRVTVKAPVFITGIPRSGTTFLHRTLAVEGDCFTSLTTWEALLAPSITQRKVVWALQGLDRRLGSPLAKALQWLAGRLPSDFDAIHEVKLQAPEEDYLCLLPAASCFILLLAFPFSTWLYQVAVLESMPAVERGPLLRFYRRCLQKHLYCHNNATYLLSKNAAFPTWPPWLREEFPDARFILCIREPVGALSSQLSSLRSARTVFATDPGGEATTELFVGIFGHFYRALAEFSSGTNPRIAVVDQEDLSRAPAAVIRGALRRVNIAESAGLGAHLDSLAPQQRSAHRHHPENFSLNTRPEQAEMQEWYAEMLSSEARIHRPGNEA